MFGFKKNLWKFSIILIKYLFTHHIWIFMQTIICFILHGHEMLSPQMTLCKLRRVKDICKDIYRNSLNFGLSSNLSCFLGFFLTFPRFPLNFHYFCYYLEVPIFQDITHPQSSQISIPGRCGKLKKISTMLGSKNWEKITKFRQSYKILIFPASPHWKSMKNPWSKLIRMIALKMCK